MPDYSFVFWVALGINVIITLRSSALWTRCCASSKDKQTEEDERCTKEELARHAALLRRYLVVFLLANLAEWLQGPYVYALYASYGYSHNEIAVLFVASFFSSMIFGSFIGGMADWGGRRRFVGVFSLIFAASCVSKHFKDFEILMAGSLLSGIGRSLLFSVFEAWLIRSHADAQLGQAYLEQSFSWSAYGNSVTAILAGLVADTASNSTKMVHQPGTKFVHFGGFLNAFDIALAALCLCGFASTICWEENFGDERTESREQAKAHKAQWYDGMKNAFVATLRSREIFLCGAISSLFEGSMYVFVFMWTPALTKLRHNDEEPLPFGVIFSIFMVASMAGSSLFSILIQKIKGEALAVGMFFVAAASMFIMASGRTDMGCLVGMLLFEVCVGMYFPVMGTLKGLIVPEDKRSAIYNLYRVPVNLIVVISLLTNPAPRVAFSLNGIMLLVASLLQYFLMSLRNRENSKEETPLIEAPNGQAAIEVA